MELTITMIVLVIISFICTLAFDWMNGYSDPASPSMFVDRGKINGKMVQGVYYDKLIDKDVRVYDDGSEEVLDIRHTAEAKSFSREVLEQVRALKTCSDVRTVSHSKPHSFAEHRCGYCDTRVTENVQNCPNCGANQ